jgi:hypothetical protein
MEMTSGGHSVGLGPRFCPACGRVESNDEGLCPHCGETRAQAGYCAICERYWPLRVGASCPKHDVELESHAPGARGEVADGEAPTWVTVATFADTLRAEAPRIRLEAEGIPTFLMGERMGNHSIYQVATGGVKLQVPEPLAADARVLLAQSWAPPVHDDLDDAWEELAPEPGALRRAVMKWVIVFLLVAPLLMTLLSLVFGP